MRHRKVQATGQGAGTQRSSPYRTGRWRTYRRRCPCHRPRSPAQWRDGRAAADAGSGVDQAAGLPVEPERSADQRAQSKAGGQGEEHDRQRKTAHGQHGADVQAGTQKDNGEFQDLLRGEFDARRGCFVGLEKRIDGHADKQGDDRCTNEVEPGAAFQRFQPLGDAGDAQCQRGSGDQGGDLL